MWTLFWDMHSGGGLKEAPYSKIYIELPEDEAKIYFYNRFKHNPERISCTCCGDDYAITESKTFEQASGYHRKCTYNNNQRIYEENKTCMSIEDYKKQDHVLVIPKSEIKEEMCKGEIPEQGYVWVD